MLKHIVWKELREILRDGRFLWAGIIVAALLAASLLAGWRQMQDESGMRRAASAETRQQWLDQGTKNPHAAAHYGVYAFQPITPLSFIDPGINDFAGTVVLLEAHKQNDFRFKVAQDTTALERFAQLSPAVVMQLLIPLQIILLSFSAIAGEREEGTLRQLLSLGVDHRTIVIGKALGVASALGVILLPAVVIGALAVTVASGSGSPVFDVHAMTDLPLRSMVLGAAYIVYLAIFLFVAFTVSVRVHSSRTALTILLGIWIVNGLVMPRAGSDLGRHVYPTLSTLEFAREIEIGKSHGVKPFDTTSPEHIAFVEQLLKKYHVQRVEDLPVNFLGLALQADEEHNFTLYDRLFGQIWGRFQQQDGLLQTLAIVSPYLAIRSISSAVAGTDFSLHRDFATQAEHYRRMLGRVMNDSIAQGAAGKSIYAADWQLVAGADLWAKVPPFDYDPPPLGRVLRQQSIALLMLFGWLVASAAALVICTRKIGEVS